MAALLKLGIPYADVMQMPVATAFDLLGIHQKKPKPKSLISPQAQSVQNHPTQKRYYATRRKAQLNQG